MDKKISLTVVIPTCNRLASLEKALTSLAVQQDRDFLIIILNGGVKKNINKIVHPFLRLLNIKIYFDNTPDLSYIRNLSWQVTDSDIVAMIDDDVTVDPQWTNEIKKGFKNNKIGAVTGPTTIPTEVLKSRDLFKFETEKNLWYKICGFLYYSLFCGGKRKEIGKLFLSGVFSTGSNFSYARRAKKTFPVDFVEACNFAVRRNVIKSLGGYDLRFKGTSEYCEMDLSLRIRRAGYRIIYNPKASVYHHVSKYGVFSRRLNWKERMSNFIYFYIHSFYPKTIKGYFLFSLYLLFLLCYYSYLFLKNNTSYI
jgi:GT2 family glycosyltransferase